MRDELGLVTFDELFERELVVLLARLFAGRFERPRTPAPLALAGLRERARVPLSLALSVPDEALVGLLELALVLAAAPSFFEAVGSSELVDALFFFAGDAGPFNVERLGDGLTGLLVLLRGGAAFAGLFDLVGGVGG